MAAPVASFVQLPVDTTNAGKKIRTQSKVIGTDTVHSHFWVQDRAQTVLGVYRLSLAQQTAQASATNGTSTGFAWLAVPTATTTKAARIRRLTVSSQHSTALATPTAPRVAASRFTFTGTASGASGGTPDKVDTTFPASALDVRTATTGMTITLVTLIGVAPIVGAVTAVGAYGPVDNSIVDPASDEDQWPVIRAGQGIALWQDTAGTASDTRKINVNIVSDDIDLT